MIQKNITKDILLGVATGDALGVPVEFLSREILSVTPVSGMLAYGSHDVPKGTFSDDSSLTFCLAEALTKPFQLMNVADNFVSWLNDDYWTHGGKLFDVGIATQKAIRNLANGVHPELAGGNGEDDNGNGSLMRILPLAIFLKDKPVEERYRIVQQVSSLTHRHIRSVISCFYYVEYALGLIDGTDIFTIYDNLKQSVFRFLASINVDQQEIEHLDRLLKGDIYTLAEKDIHSSGYVVHTLEASIWCLLTTSTYADAVLKAVNLGLDTDTTAAVTGGLAGLLYSYQSIPKEWLNELARVKDIEELADRVQNFQIPSLSMSDV